MKLIESKLTNNYYKQPDLIGDSPIIYKNLLSSYQFNKSKYIQVLINNKDDKNINNTYIELFACIIYYITNKFNKLNMDLPYQINYEIADFIINKNYRGKGYGAKILKLILNKLDGNIFLWTTIDNIGAISLYKKFGFQEIFLSNKLKKIYKSKNKWLKTDIIGFILIKNEYGKKYFN